MDKSYPERLRSYAELLQYLNEHDAAYRTLTLQLLFIAYLVAGQVALLLFWRRTLGRGDQAPSWGRRALFALFLLAGQAGLFAAWPRLVTAWLSADRTLLADVVVTLHLGLVLAVLAVLALALVGWPLRWRWTRNFWLRLFQLVVIEVVAGQAVVGIECPLTTLERELRYADDASLKEMGDASAVGRWAARTLRFNHPEDVEAYTLRAANVVGGRSENPFASAAVAWAAHEASVEGSGTFFLRVYVAAGLLTLLTWLLVPPRLPWEKEAA